MRKVINFLVILMLQVSVIFIALAVIDLKDDIKQIKLECQIPNNQL